jgi:hypothetical protein
VTLAGPLSNVALALAFTVLVSVLVHVARVAPAAAGPALELAPRMAAGVLLRPVFALESLSWVLVRWST